MLPDHRVTLDRVRAAARTIDPVFLHTPQFVSEPLSELLGVRLIVKVETLNPVRCFKGRGADWLVARADPDRPVVCASAGNFGQAMAFSCRKHGLPLTVWAATTANPLKLERMRALGAEVVLHGEDFDAAKTAARAAAAAGDARFVEDGLDLETLEGAGTMGLEWLEFPDPLDALLIPLGNGALFSGVTRVVKTGRPELRAVAVQAAGAPAMIESWRRGEVVTTDRVDTIADGVAVRLPIPQALDDLRPLVDDALLVSEDAIVEAMRLLLEHVGAVVEPAGAVGLAALLEHGDPWRGATVGTVLCGSNLTEAQRRAWL